jgi:hypothetical protein
MLMAFGILSKFSAGFVLDDAYMFVRYADNLLEAGSLTWNPGGEPTYGLTSLLFLSIVIPVRVIFTDNPSMVGGVSSLVCGLTFVVLLISLLIRVARYERVNPTLLILLGLFSLANATPALASHFVSGMDTLFALAYLTGYIFFATGLEKRPSRASAVWVGIWGGFAFLVRPDLLLFTLGVPSVGIILGRNVQERKLLTVTALISLVALIAQVVWAWNYFGSPLPLPFYTKGLSSYGPYLVHQYRLIPYTEFLHYFVSYWFLFLAIGVDLAINFDYWRHGASSLERGLLITACIFVFYYMFFVLQIMYRPQRFYYPTLPVLIFLAVRGVLRLTQRLTEAVRNVPSRAPNWVHWLVPLLISGMLLNPTLTVARDIARQSRHGRLVNFDLLDNYRDRFSDFWVGLEQVSALPDDLVIATTEVGRVAALNPQKKILDLAGLHEPQFATKEFSAAYLLDNMKPDLIYMPHPHYKQRIEQIISHGAFVQTYDHFPASRLGSIMGMAVRKDSEYYRQLSEIIGKNMPGRSRSGGE